MEKSPRRFGIFFYLLIFGAILFLLMGLFGGEEKSDISYSELNILFREEKIKSFVWEEGVLTLQLHEKDAKGRDELRYELADVEMFHDDLGTSMRRSSGTASSSAMSLSLWRAHPGTWPCCRTCW